MDLARFLHRYPVLWHAGRAGMWDDARRHGLCSVSALLDDFEIRGEARRPYESERRARPVLIEGPDGRHAWLRDQGPLALPKLAKLLDGGMNCEAWLRTLNRRVYLWCRRERLQQFLDAYPTLEQDLLTISTERLLRRADVRVEVAPLNTGATRFVRGRRGPDTFRVIEAFDGAPHKVVEVTVLDRLDRLESVVERVERVRGGDVLDVLVVSSRDLALAGASDESASRAGPEPARTDAC